MSRGTSVDVNRSEHRPRGKPWRPNATRSSESPEALALSRGSLHPRSFKVNTTASRWCRYAILEKATGSRRSHEKTQCRASQPAASSCL